MRFVSCEILYHNYFTIAGGGVLTARGMNWQMVSLVGVSPQIDEGRESSLRISSVGW